MGFEAVRKRCLANPISVSILSHLILLSAGVHFSSRLDLKPSAPEFISINLTEPAGDSRKRASPHSQSKKKGPKVQKHGVLGNKLGSSDRQLPKEGANRFLAALTQGVSQNLEYPMSLRRRGVEGQVNVDLTWNETGSLILTQVSSGSGSEALDQLALKAVREALVQISEVQSGVFDELKRMGKLDITLPIQFKLRP